MGGFTIYPGDETSLTLEYAGTTTLAFKISDPGASGETMASGSYTLKDLSKCAEGSTGSGTLITICNNGDLVEWMLEDVGTGGPQTPPVTPAFKNVDFLNPSVTWINGDFEIPSNNPCTDCNFGYGELDVYDTVASGTLSIGPGWINDDDLRSHYNGPPTPGFDWPS